jgi:hypothetical protein
VAPLAVDLFSGLGGWTDGLLEAGFRVVGFDVVPEPAYRGEFVRADVRDLDGRRFRGVKVVVASPPCQGFSLVNPQRHRGERPNAEDLSCVEATARFIADAGPKWWAVENVRGAVPFFEPYFGRPRLRYGAFYVWGRFPPFLVGRSNPRQKFGPTWPMLSVGKRRENMSRRQRAAAAAAVARIPPELAVPFSRACAVAGA